MIIAIFFLPMSARKCYICIKINQISCRRTMEMVSVKEYAASHGLAERTVRNYCIKGKIAGSKAKKSLVFAVEIVGCGGEEYVAARIESCFYRILNHADNKSHSHHLHRYILRNAKQ